MSNTAWLVVGLIVVAGFIGGYSLYLAGRKRRLTTALERLDSPDRTRTGH